MLKSNVFIVAGVLALLGFALVCASVKSVNAQAVAAPSTATSPSAADLAHLRENQAAELAARERKIHAFLNFQRAIPGKVDVFVAGSSAPTISGVELSNCQEIDGVYFYIFTSGNAAGDYYVVNADKISCVHVLKPPASRVPAANR